MNDLTHANLNRAKAPRLTGTAPPRPVVNHRQRRLRGDEDVERVLTLDQLRGERAAWAVGMGDDPVWLARQANKLRALDREIDVLSNRGNELWPASTKSS
jgi:hypothetical protein